MIKILSSKYLFKMVPLEASAADISYYYYYILLTCIITQPILAHPPIKLPTQLDPLPLLITEKKISPIG
jgi:hypothetical protein